jgi:Zn-dependent M28 family amino/carboxypeptidase
MIFSGSCARRDETQQPQLFSGEDAFELVEIQMQFGDRIPGTDAHRQTGEWIQTELEKRGWQISSQEFEYSNVQLKNIIGKSDERTSPGPIILGAHYDTRPQADLDPTHPAHPVPGANDGASGVAVLLELARVVDLEGSHYPIWLVFFDAEDSGRIDGWDWIVGSNYFVEHLAEKPEAVVIVDMVGDKDLELFFERNSTRDLAQGIWDIAILLEFDSFIPQERHSIIDDHTPFIQAGFPAVDIIDFDYAYWHTTNDTLDKISAISLEQVGRTLHQWVEQYVAE